MTFRARSMNWRVAAVVSDIDFRIASEEELRDLFAVGFSRVMQRSRTAVINGIHACSTPEQGFGFLRETVLSGQMERRHLVHVHGIYVRTVLKKFLDNGAPLTRINPQDMIIVCSLSDWFTLLGASQVEPRVLVIVSCCDVGPTSEPATHRSSISLTAISQESSVSVLLVYRHWVMSVFVERQHSGRHCGNDGENIRSFHWHLLFLFCHTHPITHLT
nr:hypothetical protein BaRGS_033497 [Batillaria attramentaria]